MSDHAGKTYRYRIRYRDPETGEEESIEREFKDTPTVSAAEWAEDLAYTLADKGWYRIESLDDARGR